MATEVLIAHPRAETGKGAARKLRAAKQVPGVVYGHKREPQSLALDARDLQKMLDRVSADTTVFELRIDGGTARTLIRDIQRHPFKREILHIDFHQHALQGFFDIPVDHLYAAPVFVSHYRKKQLKDLVVVAPDVGSAKMARGFAKRLNGSFAIIDKRRPHPNVAEVLNVVGEVEGRDCLIPDDMIDTAGTVSEAARALKGLGAKDIYVCATHALLSGPAAERLRNAPIKEVTVTDTVAIPEGHRFPQLTILSVGELLAKAIRYTHSDESVSSLFE
jgi:ribose-phosphate pyrophosphokinase